jgi:trimeric autotransporter adhesin
VPRPASQGSACSFTSCRLARESWRSGQPRSTFTGCTYTSGTSWSCTSDRNAKHAFAAISESDILAALARLPIRSWSFKADRKHTRHIGPTAQDFKAAFHIGSSPRLIRLLDEGGSALAGVQGLYRQLKAQQGEIAQLRAEVAKLERRP